MKRPQPQEDPVGICRAAVAARRAAPYTPPRPLKVGDLVQISTDPKLAQITAIDGGGAVLAPLINTETDEVDDPSRRFGWQSEELRLVPTPPLPVPGDSFVWADHLSDERLKELRTDFMRRATTKAAHEDYVERNELQGVTPDDIKAQHHAMLARVISAYEIMESLWHDLANIDDANRYTLAWFDTVHLAWMDTAIQQTRAEFYNFFASVSGSLGCDLTREERYPKKPPAAAASQSRPPKRPHAGSGAE